MADTGTRLNLQTGQSETFTVSADEMSWRLSVDELAAESLQMLRQERNAKLAETDYLALSDNTLSSEMSTYRQALRDITDTYQSLDTVVWPTKP
jgi:protein tyrosine/serine phosphatase